MAKKSAATAIIGLDYSQFEQASKAVTAIANVIQGSISSAIGNVAATAINRFASSIQDSVTSAFKLGEEMANLSRRTGVATEQYIKFKMAMERGITSDEAAIILGNNAKILARNADVFRDITLKFTATGERIQGFFYGVAERIAPVLNPLLDRLIALDLSQWGQAFAGPIADAVAIIVQLAEDGTLWETIGKAFQLAILSGADALEYIGKIGSEILNAAVAGGFDAGVMHAIEVWQEFTKWVGVAFESIISKIGDYFYKTFIDVLGLVYEIFDMAGEISKMLGLESASEVDARIAARAEDLQNRKNSLGQGPAFPTVSYSPGDSFSDTLEKILKNAGPFQFSEQTKEGIQGFTSTVSKALADFLEKNSSPSSFSNQTPLSKESFGVDSLTAVGGGGGVGIMTNIAERQLQSLQNIERAVTDGYKMGRAENFYRQNVDNPVDFTPFTRSR